MANVLPNLQFDPHANIKRVVECFNAGDMEGAQFVFDSVWEAGQSYARAALQLEPASPPEPAILKDMESS